MKYSDLVCKLDAFAPIVAFCDGTGFDLILLFDLDSRCIVLRCSSGFDSLMKENLDDLFNTLIVSGEPVDDLDIVVECDGVRYENLSFNQRSMNINGNTGILLNRISCEI